MRFMILIKASPASEGIVPPDKTFLARMTKYYDDLVRAGVMLAGEGLRPSAEGVRVRISGGQTTIIDGPFAESKELVAGFWLWQVRSKEEAIEWARRCPTPPDMADGEAGEIEIRQVIEQPEFDALLV